MPKSRRTRQEKIILQLKKQLAQSQPLQQPQSFTPKPEEDLLIQPKKSEKEKGNLSLNLNNIQVSKAEKKSTVTLSYDKSYIHKDLLKTALLSLLAIVLELVLYLALNFRK